MDDQGLGLEGVSTHSPSNLLDSAKPQKVSHKIFRRKKWIWPEQHITVSARFKMKIKKKVVGNSIDSAEKRQNMFRWIGYLLIRRRSLPIGFTKDKFLSARAASFPHAWSSSHTSQHITGRTSKGYGASPIPSFQILTFVPIRMSTAQTRECPISNK